MRRVDEINNQNTLSDGSHTEKEESKDFGQFTIGNGSSGSSYLSQSHRPHGSQEMVAASSGSNKSANQSSGSSYSFVSGAGPSQDKKKEYFVPEEHQPVLRPNYLLYSDFEKQKRLRHQREPNVRESGARPKTVKSKIKKLFNRLKRRGGSNLERIPEETEPNPYEDLLPKDEQGYSAVYGQHEGRGIHGPVNWDQHYPTFDRIGTQYREEPGTRLQKTFPRIFGSPNKPLSESKLKFLKEKGFKFKKLLGKGSFGEVWLVRQHFTELRQGKITNITRLLACKILSLRSFELKGGSVKRSIEIITQEADVYSTLNHLNIVERVQITNLFDEESEFPQPIQILIFMELMEGDLFSLIFNPDRVLDFDYRQQECGWAENPEKFTHLWTKQIVSGLRYLHENNVSHMDMKPENILYSTHMEGRHKQYIYKLTDFGLALKFESNVSNVSRVVCGTPAYIAPEIVSGAMYETKKTDIYSLGLIMADSIASEQFDRNDLIPVILNYNSRAGQQFNISRSFASLVATMIDPDPSLRPDILQVYNHYWIKMSFKKM